MSKGSRHRSISPKFKNNFDSIKWPDEEPKWVNKKRNKPEKHAYYIQPDIEPYRAVAGEDAKKGKWITSRSKEREYLKRNNCIQVGNEKDYFFKYNGKTPDNPTKDW